LCEDGSAAAAEGHDRTFLPAPSVLPASICKRARVREGGRKEGREGGREGGHEGMRVYRSERRKKESGKEEREGG